MKKAVAQPSKNLAGGLHWLNYLPDFIRNRYYLT